jgi:virginiamycin B lyase
MWFTDQGSRPAIGRITSDGRITEFVRGLRRGSIPFGIAAGGSGQVWFTDRGCSIAGSCAIGHISPSGKITESSLGLNAGSQPLGIAVGPDNQVWFADDGTAAAIGRVTETGKITEFSAGLNSGSKPVAIAAGPDGDLWFADEGSTPAIGRLVPGGGVSSNWGAQTAAIEEYSAGLLPGSEPALIALAGDSRLWFTDEGSTTAVGHVRARSTAGHVAGRSVGPSAPSWLFPNRQPVPSIVSRLAA